MRPAIRTKIAGACFFQERKCSFPNSAKIGEHGFFFGKKFGVEGNWRLTADDPRFDKEQREMKPLVHRYGLWSVADDAVGSAEDGAFDLAKMGNDFSGRPASIGRTETPKMRRNEVRSGEKTMLGTVELFNDAIKAGHGRIEASLAGARLRLRLIYCDRRSFTGRTGPASESGRYKEAPPDCSKAWARRRTLASPKAGPKIWRPTGRFPSILPQGTEMPGTPAREPVTV